MEQDFGRYLATVEERDIDLLLLEEFHISPDFVRWFADRLKAPAAEFDGAWHSVSDNDGETDLLLRVKVGKERIGVLIENKIAATEQNRQDERYHIRGIRSRDAGLYDRFVTCMCAPAAYLAGLSPDSLYEHRVSYEDIRGWYAKFGDARTQWRHRMISEAIEQGRRGYVMIVDAHKTAFQKDYWQYLQRKHPLLRMREPREKGSKSDWIILKTHDMPNGVSLDHKNEQGCMDLTFHRTRIDELLALKVNWPPDILPLQRGASTVLRKIVPKLEMGRSVADQIEQLEQIFEAAYALSKYSRILQFR